MALKRDMNLMPDFVREALEGERLIEKYHERPAYQRNDYLWWISSAKREETKRQRLRQMLDELTKGDVYMNMAWRPQQTD